MAYQLKPVGRMGQNGEVELFPSMAGSLQSGTRNITMPPAEAMIPQRQLSTPEMVDNRPGNISNPELNPWAKTPPPPPALSAMDNRPGVIKNPQLDPWDLRFRGANMTGSAEAGTPQNVPDTPETPSGTAGPSVSSSPLGPVPSLLGSRREVKTPTLLDPRERPEFDPNQRGREKAAIVGGALGLLGGGLGGAAQGATAGMGAYDKTRQADYQRRVDGVDKYNASAEKYNTRLTDKYGKELTSANNEFATRQRDRAAEIGADSRLEVAQLLAASREREGNANRKLEIQKLENSLIDIQNRDIRERVKFIGELDKEIFNLTSTMAVEEAQTLWLSRNALASQLGVPVFTEIPGTRRADGSIVPRPGMTPAGLNATTNKAAMEGLAGYRTGMLDVAKTNAATDQRKVDINQQEANNRAAGVGYYQRGGAGGDGKFGVYTLKERTNLLNELIGAGDRRNRKKAGLTAAPLPPAGKEATPAQVDAYNARLQKWEAEKAALGAEDVEWTARKMREAQAHGLVNVDGQWYLLENAPAPAPKSNAPLNLPGVSPEKPRDVMGSTLDLQGDGGLSGGSSLLNLGPQPAGQPLQITLPGGGTATARPTGGRSSRPPSTQDPKYRKADGSIDYPKWERDYNASQKGQKPSAKPATKKPGGVNPNMTFEQWKAAVRAKMGGK